MVNEAGAGAAFFLEGVFLINEAFAYTMDDLTNNVGFTFVARDLRHLDTIENIVGAASGNTSSRS